MRQYRAVLGAQPGKGYRDALSKLQTLHLAPEVGQSLSPNDVGGTAMLSRSPWEA